jgi:hypothetical protein
LDYETRKKSQEYLAEKLDEKDNFDNIDFHHMNIAYRTIKEWFSKAEKHTDFDIKNFESKLCFSAKVIWYETADEDEISVFKRINKGKIPLTNSELVKALFLNSSNFDTDKKDVVYLKQLEIASEWDRIEYALQNDSFWYFISDESPSIPRIDFLFDLMSKKRERENADTYFTFRYFNKKFKPNDDKKIIKNWKEIKDYFLTIEEWYLDRVLYHKIGFLISSGTHISEILSEKYDSGRQYSKTQFVEYLDSKIKERTFGDIDELEYGNDSRKIKNILLLHNIQTMLNNTEETTKFPFDRFKKEKWDLEHIAAIKEEKSLKTRDNQNKWLSGLREYIIDDDQLKKEIDDSARDFDKLYPRILNYFSENKKHEDINNISNLVLLNADINRSYKNTVFPRKREEIIKYDKSGRFIPICTKNVFMKYYSNSVRQFSYWGKEDRKSYYDDIVKTLAIYSEKGGSK